MLTWLQASPLSVSWRAPGVLAGPAEHGEDRVAVLAVEGEEPEHGLAVRLVARSPCDLLERLAAGEDRQHALDRPESPALSR